MPDWLKKRLSPVKSETNRWIELSEANEAFWEENSDPGIAFLNSLRSIFSATPEGRTLLLRKLGGYFESDLVDSNIPVAVILRKIELLMKQTTVPLESMVTRAGSKAKWEPCWALSCDNYGDAFYIASELPISYRLDGTWKVASSQPKKLWPMQIMTSRAVFAIDLNAVRNYGDHDIIRRRAVMLRPAHIVFDGFRYLGKNETTIIADTQPRLDATWKVSSPAVVVIKSFPRSHDDIMAKSTAAKLVFGSTIGALTSSSMAKAVRVVDHGTSIDFIGVAQNSDFVGSGIGAAGLKIGGEILAPFSFLKKTKAADDSYKITITLRFR